MMKKLLPVLLGLILAGGGFVVYTMFLSGGGKTEPPAVAQANQAKLDAAAKRARVKSPIDGAVVSLGDTFVVNLSDPGLGAFVKTDVALMVDTQTPTVAPAAGATGGPSLVEQTPIRNIVIDAISSFSSGEVATAAGRDRLKQQIITAINTAADVKQTVAIAVYFSNFAIQAQPAASTG